VARRLLVIDDEPYVGLVLQPRLEALGFEVSFARTLAAGRAALAATPPDCLLLDLHLPDGSGLDLLRELRRQPTGAALPVVVLTAEGEDRVLAELPRLGAAVLTKPFSPSKLTSQIADMLGDLGAAGETAP
jgi:two-component system, OmpR family, catabolic regulation response regulator CreB